MRRLVLRRLQTNWPPKAFSLTALTVLFFSIYFYLQKHPFFEPLILPESPLDAIIPFSELAAYPYLSLWLLMALPPWLLTTIPELKAYCAAISSLIAAGFMLFFLVPTAVPRPAPPFTHALYGWLRSVDDAGNAVPSLHVTFAIVSAICFKRYAARNGWGTGWAAAIWFWAGLVSVSTLILKQHFLIDLAGGVALALAGPWILPKFEALFGVRS